MGEESWIYGCDPETKQQSLQWKSPQSPRAKNGAAGPEFDTEHAHCFLNVKGIVHCEFVPPDTTVNFDFYYDVLKRLRENVLRKRPEFPRNHNWLLHRDNTPTHTSLKTTEFMTNNNMVIVPHPPYSPDLAPL
jgi:histone-lysine N-methyltransferase SETMAR